MAHIKVIPAMKTHADFIKSRLRRADEEECLSAFGCTGEITLGASFKYSKLAFVAVIEDEPVVIFGVFDAGDGRGVPWLLATDRITELSKYFREHSLEWVKKLLEPFDILENYVCDSNLISKKWLSRCGFSMGEPVTRGVRGKIFRRFWLKKERG